MRTPAAILYESGKPRPYAESRPLVVEDVQLAGPGEGELLVEIGGAGLCHSDLSVINGSRLRPTPLVLGHEAAGTVREVGRGVKDLHVDDHVVFGFLPTCGRCARCRAGQPSRCTIGQAANAAGTLLGGECRFQSSTGRTLHHHQGVSAFTRYTVASSHSVVRIDDSFPLDTAALFGCAVMTGVGAVLNTAEVQPGQSVVVFGMGGVGLSAVMGARIAQAGRIIAVDLVPAKLDLAKQAGATDTINAVEQEVVEAVRALTGSGADWAFEAVGSEKTLATAFAATGPGGSTISMGLPHPDATALIPACQLVAEERTLRGSYMGSCTLQQDVPRFLELYRDDKLPVDMLKTHMLKLEQINEGFDALDRAEAVRQVITFDS